MIGDAELDIIQAGIRTLFVIGFPLIIVAVAVGLLLSALQTVISVREEAMIFCAKLLAVIALVYYMAHSISESLIDLARLSFG